MFAQGMILVLCLLGTAFFAGIETGIISIHRMRLRHLAEQGDRRARILQQFLDRPDHLLGTMLVGTNLCLVCASILAASAGRTWWGVRGEAVTSVFMTVLVLVFGEYLPKAWFQGEPLRRVLPFAEVLRWCAVVLKPLYSIVNWLTQWLLPPSLKTPAPRPMFMTKDEIDLLAKEGEEHGVLSPSQRIMIRRVFDLSSKTAREVMTPAERMVTARTNLTIPECLALSRETGRLRLPVYDAEQHAYTGIVNVFDLLANPGGPPDASLRHYLRPPLFIPETTPATEVFARLRLSRQPMGLVTNARGEVIGLVTPQDIMEEIVGKL